MIDRAKMPALLAIVGKLHKEHDVGADSDSSDPEAKLAKEIHSLAVAIAGGDVQEIEDCLHEFTDCLTELDKEQDAADEGAEEEEPSYPSKRG